tara:strand:+ start:150 stop:308 length:159 start_codon:yes stop_codon:yes gene_type:complete
MSKIIARATLGGVMGWALHYILQSSTNLDISTIRIISIVLIIYTVRELIPPD